MHTHRHRQTCKLLQVLMHKHIHTITCNLFCCHVLVKRGVVTWNVKMIILQGFGAIDFAHNVYFMIIVNLREVVIILFNWVTILPRFITDSKISVKIATALRTVGTCVSAYVKLNTVKVLFVYENITRIQTHTSKVCSLIKKKKENRRPSPSNKKEVTLSTAKCKFKIYTLYFF